MDPRVRTILLDEAHLPRFDKADPTGGLEAEFEAVALRILARLYPSCYVFKFKPLVQENGLYWRPDLAIVDKECRYWFVVEVEIATHSLERHVLPQVRAFRDGDYESDLCAAAIAASTGLAHDEAATLIRYVPRYVAVVSNHEDVIWASSLAQENIQYLSVVSYERPVGPPAYLVTGLLSPAQRSLGFGQARPFQQAIRLQWSEFWRSGPYRIVDPSGVAVWDCVVEGQVVWLSKRRGVITLPESAWVQLLLQDGDLISLRQV